MHSYKSTDQIVTAMGYLIVIQHLTKLLLSFIVILLIISTSFLYQYFAFDHIQVVAYDQQVVFDLKITSDQQEFHRTSLTTPYSIKIPKGEKIEVEITDNSSMICGTLNSGFSSLQIHHSSSELKLQRDGIYLKGGSL